MNSDYGPTCTKPEEWVKRVGLDENGQLDFERIVKEWLEDVVYPEQSNRFRQRRRLRVSGITDFSTTIEYQDQTLSPPKKSNKRYIR